MSTETPIRLTLYKRQDCCLCDEMLAVVEGLRSEFRLELDSIDIGGRPDLEERFGDEIPVLFINGRKAFKYRTTQDRLRARLLRAGGDSASRREPP